MWLSPLVGGEKPRGVPRTVRRMGEWKTPVRQLNRWQKYYYGTMKPRMAKDPEVYRVIERERYRRKREKRLGHYRRLAAARSRKYRARLKLTKF